MAVVSKRPASAHGEETAPLLDSRSSTSAVARKEDHASRRALTELLLLSRRSVPVVLSYILQNSIQTGSVLIVGRLGPDELSVAAFSYMFANATAWLLGMGGTTVIDSFAGAWTSANPEELGIILQKSILVLAILYIPFILLWICSGPLLLLLGQPEYVASNTNRFLVLLIPGGLGYISFESIKKFLQVQERMAPAAHVLLLMSPLNLLFHYLLVHKFGLGLWGAPIATSITYLLSAIILAMYAVRVAKQTKTWTGFDRRAFSNLGQLFRIAVFGTIQVGTEWFAFEIVALVAGHLGRVPLAAQSVIMTFDSLGAMLPFGVGVAASARVGNLLGAQDAKGARRAAHVAAVLAAAAGGVVMAVLLATRHSFARLITDDIDVIKMTADVLPFVALFQIADGLNGSCGGVLRGLALQHIGATINLSAYYLGALPLGVFLAYRGWGLQGLWIGQCIALWITGLAEYAIVASRDWPEEVERAAKRLDAEREDVHDP